MLKFIGRHISEKNHKILVGIFFIDLGIVFVDVEEGDLSGWATKAKWQKSSECGRACRRRRRRRRRRSMRGEGGRRYRELVAPLDGIKANPTVASSQTSQSLTLSSLVVFLEYETKMK